jgi:imidazolonepropionase-like amidohydrolase
MRVVIHGGTIVPGGDTTAVEGGTLVIEHERIAGIERRRTPQDPQWDAAAKVVDASGCVVIPGLINCHVHGVAPGPLFPSAAPPPPAQQWRANLDRHLLAGTTTVLSLCGFVTMEEIAEADRSHPVNVRAATSHTPSALLAAQAADGAGLTARTAGLTVESMLADGAVAIGEIGAGHTLGGGGQDVLYIPRAVERATGVRISPAQARSIKEAALGRHICAAEYDPLAMAEALAGAGLASRLRPDQARELVSGCVMPSMRPALEAFREAGALSSTLGVPALVHSAAATAQVMREVARSHVRAGASVIACHSNHPTFTADEAVGLATELADLGFIIEACTFDLLDGRRLVETREHWDRLLAEPGLVDLMATDYGLEGRHDSLMAGVADAVTTAGITLEKAVAMATSSVADAIPGVAPGRGRLTRGAVADVAVVSADDLRDVRHVFVGGRQVVREGSLVDRVAA